MPRELHMCAWNIGGQHAYIPQLVREVGLPDVFFCLETWVMQGSDHPALHGYKHYACQRQRTNVIGRPHGGVVAYVKRDLVAGGVSVTKDAHAGFVCVQLRAFRLAVIGSYIPPVTSVLLSDGRLHPQPVVALQELICKLQAEGMHIVLLGDLNARTHNKPDFDLAVVQALADSGVPGPYMHYASIPVDRAALEEKACCSRGDELLACLSECNMVLLNGRAPAGDDTHGQFTCSRSGGE